MKIQITSQVTNGKLTRNRNQLTEAIKSFEGNTIAITIDKAKKKRSNPQNSFLWGCCYPIVQNCLKETGNNFTIDNVHDLLKMKFLKESVLVNEETGECIERIKSTTELSTTDFCLYVSEIQKFTEEWFGVLIPHPSTELKLEL